MDRRRLTQTRKVTIGIAVLFIVIAAFVVLRTGQKRFFYPVAPPMPPVVSKTTSEILGELEAVLKTKAPEVLAALQPGLSDAELAALEKQAGFRLPEDLRNFYCWHNGSHVETIGVSELIAGHRFLPLSVAIQEKEAVAKQLGEISLVQKAAFSVFAGHRKTWVTLFADGAGDGYFYDPVRMESEGSIFYCFAEDGQYVFFPSIKNLLAGTVKCWVDGAFDWRKSSEQSPVLEDAEREGKIWLEFGAQNQR